MQSGFAQMQHPLAVLWVGKRLKAAWRRAIFFKGQLSTLTGRSHRLRLRSMAKIPRVANVKVASA